MNILHNNPVDRLFVLAIHTRSLDELCLDAGYGFWMFIGIKMDSQCVDHVGRYVFQAERIDWGLVACRDCVKGEYYTPLLSLPGVEKVPWYLALSLGAVSKLDLYCYTYPVFPRISLELPTYLPRTLAGLYGHEY